MTACNPQWYFPALMLTRGAAQSSTLQIDAVDADKCDCAGSDAKAVLLQRFAMIRKTGGNIL